MCKKIGYFMTPELALSSTYHNYCMIWSFHGDQH
jgi:hypothetical protein